MSAERLLPEEHGGYGMLLFPIASALALPEAGVAGWATGAAFLLVFLAHRAALIALGWRPAPGSRARAATSALVAAALAIGLIAYAATQEPSLAPALCVPASGAAGFLVLLRARSERTAMGELAAALVLSSCVLPMAVASGAGAGTGLELALVWTAGFAAIALAVRSVLERGRPARASRFRALSAMVILVALGIGARGTVPLTPSQLPLLGLAAWLSVRPPGARQMKSVGWALVAACGLTLAIGTHLW